ncbi:hypothetical protein [Streptomyces jumonjinensis]|uniref:hypothetical protein n=1 Tax=Streptomyces jumonjinensis TaxID=1945 RepID=UPI001296AA1D|nr:hypothetical protein [Streptomyces jumonjinensis]
MIHSFLREAGPEYLAGVLVLVTGAAASAMLRIWNKRRPVDHDQPPPSQTDENR